MKSFVRQNTATIICLLCVITLVCFIVDGCSKDSSPTGPFDPPSYPNMAGHWTGTGSWWDSFNINVGWVADFVQQTDSTFNGTMTDTYTAPGSMFNYKLTWYVKGSATMSGRVTIAETSRVAVNWPISSMYLPAFKTYAACSLCSNRDTLMYSGPGPQPSATPEVFWLARQK